MINFFLQNESAINAVCLLLVTGGIICDSLNKNMFVKFMIAFAWRGVFVSVIFNGVFKGF